VPQHYLAIQVDPYKKLEVSDFQIYNDIKALKEKTSKKMIYCSLGTIADVHNRKASQAFFKLLIELMKSRPEWHLVLSLQSLASSKLPALSSNVSLYNYVPQFDILPLFDLMITHAGANSVFECIHAKVPMLAFPLNDSWDQNGNAARIVYHQLGLMGRIQSIESKQLEQLILKIIENQEFKKNISQMRQNCIAEYSQEKIWACLHQYLIQSIPSLAHQNA
jgi:MGT family glycosyltransferase